MSQQSFSSHASCSEYWTISKRKQESNFKSGVRSSLENEKTRCLLAGLCQDLCRLRAGS
jgi:hypothetical protein